MNTPVLIAARNEAEHIGRSLAALPRDVEPIVIPNGCEDNTAEIARDYGATVLRCDVESKVRALQTAVWHLGERATEPFIIMDADTRPMQPKNWLSKMLQARRNLAADKPAIVAGGVKFEGGASPNFHSLRFSAKQFITRHDATRGEFRGNNLLLHPQNHSTVNDILRLGLVWPGEDLALKDIILRNGGAGIKTVHPRATVYSDGSRLLSMHDWIHASSHNPTSSDYSVDAPPGHVPYTGQIEDFLQDIPAYTPLTVQPS